MSSVVLNVFGMLCPSAIFINHITSLFMHSLSGMILLSLAAPFYTEGVFAWNLFYIKQLFTNLILFHFLTKNSNTHAYVHSWLPNNGDRNQQNNQLVLSLFLLKNVFILVSNPIHWYYIFLLTSLFQAG